MCVFFQGPSEGAIETVAASKQLVSFQQVYCRRIKVSLFIKRDTLLQKTARERMAVNKDLTVCRT